MLENNETFAALTAEIVAAYVSHNSIPQADVAGLITRTYAAIAGLQALPLPRVEEKPVPAVSIRKSIAANYLICLEDGKKFKSLKRHLWTAFNMSPEQYREKWNLPPDYPMVAPAYAEARSQLAKKMGLGQRRQKILRGGRSRGLVLSQI